MTVQQQYKDPLLCLAALASTPFCWPWLTMIQSGVAHRHAREVAAPLLSSHYNHAIQFITLQHSYHTPHTVSPPPLLLLSSRQVLARSLQFSLGWPMAVLVGSLLLGTVFWDAPGTPGRVQLRAGFLAFSLLFLVALVGSCLPCLFRVSAMPGMLSEAVTMHFRRVLTGLFVLHCVPWLCSCHVLTLLSTISYCGDEKVG